MNSMIINSILETHAKQVGMEQGKIRFTLLLISNPCVEKKTL